MPELIFMPIGFGEDVKTVTIDLTGKTPEQVMEELEEGETNG